MRYMFPPRNFVIVLIGIFLLAGCAQKFTADVTRFHELAAPSGETFAVVPNAEQQGGLAFQEYAGLVRAELERLGFTPATSQDTADYLVRMDYGTTAGREVQEDRSRVSVGVGVGGGGRSSTRVGVGANIGLGGGSERASVAIRNLSLTMTRQSDGQRVFEGHVTSEGRISNLSDVMPYLVDAMFTDFPGESGTTQTVKIKVTDDAD